jgi:tRNA1Val (adenine37-N6)-methyltransferase
VSERQHPPVVKSPIGEVTVDTLLRGRVKLFQPARGFRASVDPVLLSGFVSPPLGRFLDLGCGTGAVAFLLLARDPEARGVGIELQPRLASLAASAVVENGFQERFQVVSGDMRQPQLPAASFDLVVANPPFQPRGHGELPPDEEKSIAHHEVAVTLTEWLQTATRLVRPEGRVAAVFAASRTAELMQALAEHGLCPLRLRPVYPRPGVPATRVLVEARRLPGPRPLSLEPPLWVHEGDRYSPEVRQLLGEEE